MRFLSFLLLACIAGAGCLADVGLADRPEPQPQIVTFQDCEQMHLFVPAQASAYASYVPEGFAMVVPEGAEDTVLLPAWFDHCLEYAGLSGMVPEFQVVGDAWLAVPVQVPASYGLEPVTLDVVPVRGVATTDTAAILEAWGLGTAIEVGSVGKLVSANTGSINNQGLRSTVFEARGPSWTWSAAAETVDEGASWSGDDMRIWISDGGQATEYILVESAGGTDEGYGGAALLGDWPEAPDGAPGALAHVVRETGFTWTLRSVAE